MTKEEREDVIQYLENLRLIQSDNFMKDGISKAIEALKQEPCNDYISRKSVEELISNNNDKYGYSDRFHEFTEECMKLPPVQPKQDWISVSERLPEDKQEILVTRKSEKIECIMWNTWWHEQTRYPSDKVIAWMPLPKPYKENKE